MKLKLSPKLVALITSGIVSLSPISPGLAGTFEEQEVDQTNYIAIAFPFGDNKYNLWLIEQIPGKKTCWSESGSNPVVVDLLLMNFDFTGQCRRGTDSNSYSIRMDGEDYGLDYIFRIVQGNGELLLLGTPRSDNTKPELIVGRTNGQTQGFLKINLEPGWHFSRRSYQGKPLGHLYFSYTNPSPMTTPLPTDTTVPMTTDTTVPMTTDTTVPMTRDTTVPMTRDTTVPMTRDTTVPMTTDTTVPMTTDTTVPPPNSQVFPGVIDITKPSTPTPNP
jgi:hypothetical protein